MSVIIPTYNRADIVTRAIDSVLNQTMSDLECLVVDDGSTDNTEKVVHNYDDSRVVYLDHKENQGGSAARNTGLEVAKGEFAAFLDSDDEWLASKLERQLVRYNSTKSCAVYCDVTRNREGWLKHFIDPLFEKKTGKEGGEELIPEVLTMRLAVHAGQTLLVEMPLIRNIDGFDESFNRHQDIEFLVRILQQGSLTFVDAPLVRKYESPHPEADTVAEAKQHLFEKFADEIEEAERNGYPVSASHRFELAKAYYREGRFKRGTNFLRDSHATSLRQYAGLAWSMFSGIRRTLP